jgi:hypothetical protein
MIMSFPRLLPRLPRAALLMTVALTLTVPALAQSATPGADGRYRTVLMGVAARRGVKDKELVHALSDVVLGIYTNDTNRIVIGPEDIRRALEWEQSRQQAGCDDSKCLAEVGAALDAARIVSGTLDAIGDGYILNLAEIDAKSLEPIARGQREIKKDEAELVRGTRALAEEVLQKAAATTVQASVTSTTPAASTTFASGAGTMEVNTDPRGAKLQLAGQDIGVAPTRIDNLAVGTHKLRITRDDYEPIDVDVAVFGGGTTKVDAQMRINRKIAEQNLEVRRARWRDEAGSQEIWGWSKAVAGGAVGVVGLGITGATLGEPGGMLVGLSVAGAGAGVLAWGVIDLLNPPPEPVPEWELDRKVTVTPPKGQGDAQVKLIQEAPKPFATR